MGTRMLNFDNVGPSGELHDIVKELFNTLLLFLFNVKKQKQTKIKFMQLSTQPFIADTWGMTRSSFTERLADHCVTVMLNIDNFVVMHR